MNLHALAELTSLAIDLDTVVQELLEGRAVKDTVARRTRVVDDELVLSSSRFSGSGFGLEEQEETKYTMISLLRRELSKAVLGVTNHLDGGGRGRRVLRR